jgi:hypothetical protein
MFSSLFTNPVSTEQEKVKASADVKQAMKRVEGFIEDKDKDGYVQDRKAIKEIQQGFGLRK